MKSTNTFGIQFIIRVPKNEKATEAAVYARITVNGRRSEVSLKKKLTQNSGTKPKVALKEKGMKAPALTTTSSVLGV